MRLLRFPAVLVAILMVAPASLAAQDPGGSASRRVALDTVMGVQDFMRTTRPWPVQVVVDTFISAEVGRGWQASVRPVLWRVGGNWEPLLDQASLKREFRHQDQRRVDPG